LKHVNHQNAFADTHRFKIVIPELFRMWKKKTKARISHRVAVAAVFMFVAPINKDNSSPQMARRAIAIEYHRKNLVCLAWYGLRKFFEEVRMDKKQRQRCDNDFAAEGRRRVLLLSTNTPTQSFPTHFASLRFAPLIAVLRDAKEG
jgi:hypothetical protein